MAKFQLNILILWPIDSRAGCNWPLRALAFVSLLASSPLTKIGISPMIPRSEWLAPLSRSWNVHKNAQKFDWKTQSKIVFDHTWLFHGKICLSLWWFLRIFWTRNKPSQHVDPATFLVASDSVLRTAGRAQWNPGVDEQQRRRWQLQKQVGERVLLFQPSIRKL